MNNDDDSVVKTAAEYTYACSYPFAGIGYFIIFLMISPGAFVFVKRCLIWPVQLLLGTANNNVGAEEVGVNQDTSNSFGMEGENQMHMGGSGSTLFYIRRTSTPTSLYCDWDETDLCDEINRRYTAVGISVSP